MNPHATERRRLELSRATTWPGVTAVVLLNLAGSNAQAVERVVLNGGTVDVFFAPQDDIGLAVATAIAGAKRRVLLAGYYFTHADIARALAGAKARGLDVRVVLDSSQDRDRYTGVTYLRNNGVPVWINSRHAVMHQKVLVIDDDVAFGSANFTKAAMGGRKVSPAQSNSENFNVFVGVPALAKSYSDEFERLVAESTN